MSPDDETKPESPERKRGGMSELKLLIRALPLLVVLVFLIYYVTERKQLFPDNREITDPPKAEYLVFPPDNPAGAIASTEQAGKPQKPEKPEKAEPKDTAKKEASGKEVAKTGKESGKDATKEPVKDVSKDSKTAEKSPAGAAGQPGQVEITGPVEGGYVVIFTSRKLVALVKDQKYLRAYPNATVPESGKMWGRPPTGNYMVVDQDIQNGVPTLILSCPGSKDATAALQAKKITQAEHDAIVQAEKKRATPPTTKIGSALRIWGDGGAGKKAHPGDFSVTPDQMELLWTATRRGTPVVIME